MSPEETVPIGEAEQRRAPATIGANDVDLFATVPT